MSLAVDTVSDERTPAPTCALPVRACSEPAAGFNGAHPELCARHARTRIVLKERARRDKRAQILGRAR